MSIRVILIRAAIQPYGVYCQVFSPHVSADSYIRGRRFRRYGTVANGEYGAVRVTFHERMVVDSVSAAGVTGCAPELIPEHDVAVTDSSAAGFDDLAVRKPAATALYERDHSESTIVSRAGVWMGTCSLVEIFEYLQCRLGDVAGFQTFLRKCFVNIGSVGRAYVCEIENPKVVRDVQGAMRSWPLQRSRGYGIDAIDQNRRTSHRHLHVARDKLLGAMHWGSG